jgi:D-beta-D-heptose 7-phosphate kinase/D-beta-D-heptose 1-phosphate adenosyltransferase
MPGKVVKLAELKKLRASWKRRKKMVVFTNGCFDLIHRGHVQYLEQARKLGDLLIVGLNTDASVRKIKGTKRPILLQKERAEILCAFWFVDYVVLFHEDTPLKLIRAIKPDVLIKGADWSLGKIVGADIVLKNRGKVKRIKFSKGCSTSGIIEKIIKNYCK